MSKKIQRGDQLGSARLGVKTPDVIAFLAAAGYMQSVLTVAHHASLWPQDGQVRTVEAPNIIFLVIALVLGMYSWRKNGPKPSIVIIITVTVLASASLFWLSGLRTNFY